MAWSVEDATRLMQDAGFRDLFEDENSPVAREIESLERIALDPGSDPAKAHDAACRRAGILKVWESVQGTIDAEAQRLDQEAAKPSPYRSRYFQRRPS